MQFDPPPPGEFNVVGVLGNPGNGFGGIPVTLLSNIPDAVEMRFGSTLDELALTEWQGYSTETPFWMRTGGGECTIYAEYRDAFGNVTAVQAIAPPFNDELGTDYIFPPSGAIQPEGSADIWKQDFSGGHDTWVSYDYNSVDHNGSNVFYSASWNSTGGVDNGAYVWTDASRWLIDTPETPHSVLALLTYSQWGTFPDNYFIDLNGTTAEFYLRGDNLDLKGGSAYFWLVDQYGRWHQRDIVLNIGNGDWAVNSVDLGFDTSGWENSWTQNSSVGLNYSAIRSWGIAFVGFPPGIEPTGVLALDEFTITRRSMDIEGTAGADTLSGGRGDDTLAGGDGDDVLDGGEGNDFLRGGNGNDTLTGGAGSDTLEGGAGDDVYHADGDDTIVELEGEGFDMVYSAGSHQLGANVEAVYMLGPDNYVGKGNDAANWIYGAAGNDTLSGYGGDDLLDGGDGDDVLDGGEGNDILRGGNGNDTLTGGAGSDTLEGGAGDDVYHADGDDTIVELEGEGFDMVYSAGSHQLGANVEAVYMLGPDNYVGKGNDAANWIYGAAGNDTLSGYGGNDLLDGGDGDDVLDGGEGNDSLRGGNGDDLFVFTGKFGRDAITGFVAGAGSEDRIQFSVDDFMDFAAVQAASSPYLDGTLITSGENWVYLADVNINSLHEDDFLLV